MAATLQTLLASSGPALPEAELSQGLLPCLKALGVHPALLFVCVYGGHKTQIKAGQQQPVVCSERDVEVSLVLQEKLWEHGRISLGQLPLLPVRWTEIAMGLYCPVGKVIPAASGGYGPE